MTNNYLVNIWVTKDAKFVEIPNKYADAKINKNGQPDKRYNKCKELMLWVKEIEHD